MTFTIAEINYLTRLAKKDQKLAKLLDRLMDAADVEVDVTFAKYEEEE